MQPIADSNRIAMQAMTPVIGLSPFEAPDVRLVLALARAGALGVLDLGHDVTAARKALTQIAQRIAGPFGVRLPEPGPVADLDLPHWAKVVVVRASAGRLPRGPRAVIAEVTSLEEVRLAEEQGCDGLIVKGNEAGGRVADETSFVLLQRVLPETRLPIWVQGGIGLHSGAACLAAGARGVVLDAQLALLEEASTAPAIRRALSTMDGTETVVVAGHRIYARPGARKPSAGATAAQVAGDLGASDPAVHLVALGQDAAFARGFAERFGTVERLVRALYTGFDGHLRQARALAPLAPNAPMARALRTEFPIAQGPMTRVSDRPAFAHAVADGGGLPFLALSLMRGAEARALLDETRARLGTRSWGVGILGFVPPDLRDEQMALLAEVQPPFALIAGGRASQALALERAGVATFLHVPSPALLDLFLADGARRFVFEGRECGGHVGPRSSFVLWEGAIERLLACDRLHDVSVLFAGGVHDALSARMVATLAAPLAARGAKIGVLMGTAYLFTEEAVASGAILPAFQAAALRCEGTALLETAPGHATRCAVNDYVQVFESERARLAATAGDAQTSWAELERLNLGRLRLAAKGLRREGEQLTAVTEEEQRREGMFMIGQVAALRQSVCTVRALHRQVSEQSTQELGRVEVTRGEESDAQGACVAIVGMACIYPDAPDKESFWANVVLGKSAIREVPRTRWDPDLYFDPEGTGSKTPSKWGGFVPETLFDPGAYGIPPRSLAAIDPVQILALEVARRALDDAGYATQPFDRERTSVVFGAEAGGDLTSGYGFRASFPQHVGALPKQLDDNLPKLTEDSFPGVLSNVIAGRIANRLDLRGVNYTVDAACASSLAALDVACKELRSGGSDMVIAGGADLHNGIYDYLMFASVHALSPTGQCRPFDARADGIALGEGVAAVVCKRLADAERDGDRIYAVLESVAGSSDGKSLGLTAPRKEGQLRALERAYASARISPADVGLVEAHGTGTAVGDRTELGALTELFGAAGAARGRCTLGSVKAQIGHTKCAAGMAGLIKTALAAYHGVLPPTRNIEVPTPAYDAAASPFVLRDVAAPWLEDRRVAAVSAFGFGGTNFHAVLESHRPAEGPALVQWPAELFVVRAADDRGLLEALRVLEAASATEVPSSLRELAASVAVRQGDAPPRVAIVATSLPDLRTKVAAARERRTVAGVHFVAPLEGQVAFLFPGQGSQRTGMLGDLFLAFSEVGTLLSSRGWVGARLFPGGAFTADERAAQERALQDTRVAQPALGIVELAYARLLARVGVRPAMVAGHSYGELVALAVAGAFDAPTLLRLSEARGRCIGEAAGDTPGTMAAVRGRVGDVQEVLRDQQGVTLANHNAPDQVVIAGSHEAVARACQRLESAGHSTRTLPVACAFHSPLVAQASAAFARQLSTVEVAPPRIPVYANGTAAPYGRTVDEVRATLAAQIAQPVRFAEQIDAMYAAGARIFVEVGPGGVLSDLVARIVGARPHATVTCDQREAPGLTSFLAAAARLVALGVDVDPNPLFEGRVAARDLEALVRERVASPTSWLVDGRGARPVHGDLPEFAMGPLQSPVAVDGVEGDREGVVHEYLRSMREVVEQQRQIMLAYLGDGAVVPAPAPSRAAVASRPTETPTKTLPAVTPATPEEILVATISERTGYPREMLDPKLDLEADLGIDSIKRIEILGAVRDQLRLGVGGEAEATRLMSVFDELASAKTLGVMAGLLTSKLDPGPPVKRIVELPAAPLEPSIKRYVVEVMPAPVGTDGVSESIRGRLFVITRDQLGVGEELRRLLELQGARVRLLAPEEAMGDDIDGLVHLQALATDSDAGVRALFSRAKEATENGAAWIVAATGLGGRFGHDARVRTLGPSGGMSGFLKSLAKERPALCVRAVDLDPEESPTRLAEQVLQELLASDIHVEVGYLAGKRHTLIAAHRPATMARTAPVEIDEHSVVLVTGGARGITAQIALHMARRFRCTLELVGRSPAPHDGEAPELRAATDARALRRLLAGRNRQGATATLADIDREAQRVLAAREIRNTLEAIHRTGARASYHPVDVSDDDAFSALVDGLRARHGRIHGVVHGAGLIEDKLFSDKTADSFDRVFATKVVGANVLARKLAPDARFFVLFSSIAGTFGSRGQTDYAAANEALDKLAQRLHRTVPGRVLSIAWGPWQGVGMVHPELAREYQRRGIALIDPQEGVERFFHELLSGSDPQVILTAAPAEALG